MTRYHLTAVDAEGREIRNTVFYGCDFKEAYAEARRWLRNLGNHVKDVRVRTATLS